MRKILVLITIFALTIVTISSVAADTHQISEGSPATVTLWAGQTIDAGDVTIATQGGNLIVSYQTSDGWGLKETHLYLGKDVPTKSAPGKFDFSMEGLGGVDFCSYTVSLSDLEIESGDIFYVAAHAALSGGESAWAEGDLIREHANWATYVTCKLGPGPF